MRSDDDEALGVTVAGQGEVGVGARVVPDLQPVIAGEVLEETKRIRLDRREGRAAHALRIGRTGGDRLEEIARGFEVDVAIVGGLRLERGHGAVSMKTTPAFCSSSMTVPTRSRTETMFSRSR